MLSIKTESLKQLLLCKSSSSQLKGVNTIAIARVVMAIKSKVPQTEIDDVSDDDLAAQYRGLHGWKTFG